jgi:hypothetical protein
MNGADFFGSVVFEFPCPVADFRHILAVSGDVFVVFDELIADRLFRVGSEITKLWDAVDYVPHQVKAVQIIPDNHIKGCGRGSFLLITPDMKVFVICPAISQAVD